MILITFKNALRNGPLQKVANRYPPVLRQYHNIWFRYYLRTWSATLSLTRSQVQLVAICVNPNYVKVVFHQRVKLGDTSRDSARNKFLTSPHQTTCPIRSFKTHMITEPVSFTHSKNPSKTRRKPILMKNPSIILDLAYLGYRNSDSTILQPVYSLYKCGARQHGLGPVHVTLVICCEIQ